MKSTDQAKQAGFADRLKEASVQDRGATGNRRSGSLPSGGASHSEKRVAFLHSPAGFSDHMKELEGASKRQLNAAGQGDYNKLMRPATVIGDSRPGRRLQDMARSADKNLVSKVDSFRRAGSAAASKLPKGLGKAGLIAAGGVAAGIGGKHLYDKYKAKKEKTKEASTQDRGAAGSSPTRHRAMSAPVGGNHSESNIVGDFFRHGKPPAKASVVASPTRSVGAEIASKLPKHLGKAGIVAGGLAAGGLAAAGAKHLYDRSKSKEASVAAGLGSLGHKVVGAGLGAARSMGQGENFTKVLRKGVELSGGTKNLARNVGIGAVGAGVAGAGAAGFAAGSR